MPGNEGRAWRVVRSRVLRKQPVCGLCGQPIDPALRWPHPRSGSVDHITARSLGGARLDPANLRATHLTCNVKRGTGASATVQRTSRNW